MAFLRKIFRAQRGTMYELSLAHKSDRARKPGEEISIYRGPGIVLTGRGAAYVDTDRTHHRNRAVELATGWVKTKQPNPRDQLPQVLNSQRQGGDREETRSPPRWNKTRWNRKAAARLLKVSYRTLLYKIDQYHMMGPSPSR